MSDPTGQPEPKHPVAWVADADAVHRFGRLLRPVATALIDAGYPLSLVCDDRADLTDLPEQAMRIVRYRPRRLWLPHRRWLESLGADIRPHHPTVLHALASSAVPLTARLADVLDVPYVASCWDMEAVDALSPHDQHVGALLAGSSHLRDALSPHDPTRVRLVRPGLTAVTHSQCLQRTDRATSVIICGHLTAPGPFEAVLSTVGKLRDDGMDLELFLVGGGPAERPLRRIAASLGLVSGLTFAGHHPLRQLAAVLDQADLFIAPRRHDSVGIRTLMAMAAGAAVVCAEQPASDFVIPGTTATVFEEGRGADLLKKLRGLLDNPASTQAQATTALDHLRQHHQVGKMVSDVIDAYQSVARD